MGVRGVKNYHKLREVIYGRSLTNALVVKLSWIATCVFDFRPEFINDVSFVGG